MSRLFLAIDIADTVRDAIAARREPIPGVRWTRPENLHVTLRFIGDVKATEQEACRNRLSSVNSGSFVLTSTDALTLPRRGPARVLALAWAASDPLLHLHEATSTVLGEAIGLKRERRPYTPHVTVARFRDAKRAAVRHADAIVRRIPPSSFVVTEYSLYESHLTPQGARHTRLATYPLD
jgi:RNA 2',3'-cyclic 3'-phosphodiesterase